MKHTSVQKAMKPTSSVGLRFTLATASTTGADGCVSCPTEGITCPPCPPKYECQLRLGTCKTCPLVSCERQELEESRSSSLIGGAVGGACAAAVLLALAVFALVYRKRRARAFLVDDAEYSSDKTADPHDLAPPHERGGDREKLGLLRNTSLKTAANATPARSMRLGSAASLRRRLLSYELFTRPQNRRTRLGGSAGGSSARLARQQQVVANANASMFSHTLPTNTLSFRHSVATTVLTTNASNILPIAYIPGVTVRPNAQNTRLLFSNDDSVDDDDDEYLVFSDLNTISNASIVQGESPAPMRPGLRPGAQPRIVNVARIEEEEEEEEEEDDEEVDDEEEEELESDQDTEEKGDLDLDVDSDIGQIVMATGQGDAAAAAAGERLLVAPSDTGLFVFDVEMERR